VITAAIRIRFESAGLTALLLFHCPAEKFSTDECVLDSRWFGHQQEWSPYEAYLLRGVAAEEGGNNPVNLSEIVMLLVFLTAFVVVPVIFIQCGSRRRNSITSSLHECPHCGAQNHKAKDRCYCCGYGFISSKSDTPDAALIQRVKQADDGKMKRVVEAQTPEAVEDRTLHA